jgi:hypothetical protein
MPFVPLARQFAPGTLLRTKRLAPGSNKEPATSCRSAAGHAAMYAPPVFLEQHYYDPPEPLWPTGHDRARNVTCPDACDVDTGELEFELE